MGQTYVKPTGEQIKLGMDAGWTREQCERGYDIFDYNAYGLLEIEAIGDIYCSTADQDGYSDEACAREAERVGFCKIIPVEELPENFTDSSGSLRWFGWVDTPENRKAIEDYCKKVGGNND